MAVRAAPGRGQGRATQPYYPMFVKLEGRGVVVIGGGAVALRKVESLLACGSLVRLIAPELSQELASLAEDGLVAASLRRYQPGDLAGALLVVAATDDESVNRQVFAEANERNILCNVVDVPELCSFIVPSVISRGKLTIAVSSNGRVPSVSKLVRQRIEAAVGPEYEEYLDLMAALRPRVKSLYATPEDRRQAWERIHRSDVLNAIRAGDKPRARKIVEACL